MAASAMAIQSHGHGLHQRPLSSLCLSSSTSSSLPSHMHPRKCRKFSLVPTALFWGQQRQSSKRVTPRPQRENLVISADLLSQQANQETTRDSDAPPLTLTVSVVSSISLVPAEAWDLCAIEAAGPESANPFVAHAFLSSLEDSKSAVAEEGWLPQHLVARDADNEVLGVVPLYMKSHSYGEYVFDHAWANAFYRYGGQYYPKLQCCVPFTPATGPRILVRAGPFRDQVFDGLVRCMQQLTDQMKASSLHITFPERQEWEKVAKLGYLQRKGLPYHWKNRNYSNFNDFLMDLKQSKRKNIRQERKKVVAQNITMKRLGGDDIKPYHWDAFYNFYRNSKHY